jgi:hypothetical protein
LPPHGHEGDAIDGGETTGRIRRYNDSLGHRVGRVAGRVRGPCGDEVTEAPMCGAHTVNRHGMRVEIGEKRARLLGAER